jgi:glutathione S-transferase
MKLYHRKGAGRPIRVSWALGEAGIDHEVVVMTPEEAQGAEHEARHPLHRVPVIDTSDGPIFESAALLLHIGDLAGDDSLLPPPGTHERALVYQWVLFVMTEIEPALVEMFTTSESDPARADVARERLDKAAAVLERAVGPRKYLVGRQFTLADLLTTDIFELARLLGGVEPPAGLAEYVERHRARPARQKAEELFAA